MGSQPGVLATYAVSKTYRGRTVVQDVSIQVKAGEIVGLLGPNGAGKTTSIAKLAHYYQQQGKRVMLAAGDTFRAAAGKQVSQALPIGRE